MLDIVIRLIELRRKFECYQTSSVASFSVFISSVSIVFSLRFFVEALVAVTRPELIRVCNYLE
jgi:hypothetical protein